MPPLVSARRSAAANKLVALCMMFILALSGCSSSSDSDSIDPLLAQAADEFNQTTPMMVDAETRLDNTAALPNKTLAYNYTLINFARDDFSEDELSTMKDTQTEMLTNQVRSSSAMKDLRDYGTNFMYIYRANDGFELFAIEIPSEG